MSNNLLKGKRGIIFGALNDQPIAWKVAERAVEEGATITLSNPSCNGRGANRSRALTISLIFIIGRKFGCKDNK